MKKQFIQLYTENVIFSASAMVVTVRFMIDGKQIKPFVIISLLTSILSASFIQYKFYVERYKQQAFLIQKQDKKFQDFSLDAQIFIANPFYIGGLKQNSIEIIQFPEFFREIIQEEYLIDLQPPQKVYIFCCMFLSLLIMSSLLTMSWISIFRIDGIFGVITGIILTSPQYITYLRLSLKKCQNKKERSQTITKFLLGIPIYGLSGIMLFLIKLTSEKLPLLPSIQESWTINFFPSWYDYFMKQTFSTIWILTLGYILDTAKFQDTIIAQFQIKNVDNFNRIQSPDSQFRQIYNIMLIVFTIFTILNILYFLEYLDRTYINKEKYEQYQKIKDSNLINIQFGNFLKELEPQKFQKLKKFCENEIQVQLPIEQSKSICPLDLQNSNDNSHSIVRSNYRNFTINQEYLDQNRSKSIFCNQKIQDSLSLPCTNENTERINCQTDLLQQIQDSEKIQKNQNIFCTHNTPNVSIYYKNSIENKDKLYDFSQIDSIQNSPQIININDIKNDYLDDFYISQQIQSIPLSQQRRRKSINQK